MGEAQYAKVVWACGKDVIGGVYKVSVQEQTHGMVFYRFRFSITLPILLFVYHNKAQYFLISITSTVAIHHDLRYVAALPSYSLNTFLLD